MVVFYILFAFLSMGTTEVEDNAIAYFTRTFISEARSEEGDQESWPPFVIPDEAQRRSGIPSLGAET